MLMQKIIVLGMKERIDELGDRLSRNKAFVEIEPDGDFRTFLEKEIGFEYTLKPLFGTPLQLCKYYKAVILNQEELPNNKYLGKKLDTVAMGVESGIIRFRDIDDFD